MLELLHSAPGAPGRRGFTFARAVEFAAELIRIAPRIRPWKSGIDGGHTRGTHGSPGIGCGIPLPQGVPGSLAPARGVTP